MNNRGNSPKKRSLLLPPLAQFNATDDFIQSPTWALNGVDVVTDMHKRASTPGLPVIKFAAPMPLSTPPAAIKIRSMLLPPLVQFDDTRDFIPSLSPPRQVVNQKASLRALPAIEMAAPKSIATPAASSTALVQDQDDNIVADINEKAQPLELRITRPTPPEIPPPAVSRSAKFRSDQRSVEEVAYSRLIYMLQSKYLLSFSINEMKENIALMLSQLSANHRYDLRNPSVDKPSKPSALKDELVALQVELARTTSEYKELSENPELKAFEKNPVAEEQAKRILQEKIAAKGLPYQWLAMPQSAPLKKAPTNYPRLPVIYEEPAKAVLVKRPKSRKNLARNVKPVFALPKLAMNHAAPIAKRKQLKKPKAFYLPIVIPKKRHTRPERLNRVIHQQPLKNVLSNESPQLISKPKPMVDKRRPSFFFAASPPAIALIKPPIRTPKIARATVPGFFGMLPPISPVIPKLDIHRAEQLREGLPAARHSKPRG